MESVEFYAELLFHSKKLGGPKEFSKEQIKKLYEIRKKMGMSGKHPANLCPNAKNGVMNCHTCGIPDCAVAEDDTKEAELIAQIAKKVMAQLEK